MTYVLMADVDVGAVQPSEERLPLGLLLGGRTGFLYRLRYCVGSISGAEEKAGSFQDWAQIVRWRLRGPYGGALGRNPLESRSQ
jgi:hypothetical protein